jgi:uncharacterized protein (DUF1778 family)
MSTSRISLRIPTADLAEIDRRARARHTTRTAFMRGAALAEDLVQTHDEKWLDELADFVERLDERLESVERHVLLGSLEARTAQSLAD